MQGNVVAAARWLAASLVLASTILVVGLRWPLTSPSGRTPAAVEAVAAAPADCVQELLDESEELRRAGDEWERFWFLDRPSQLTPFRTRSGLGP